MHKRNDAPENVKSEIDLLIKNNKDIIGNVEQHLKVLSQVYLVGEWHTQTKHKIFTSDLIKIIHPQVFFSEAYPVDKQHIPEVNLTINNLLEHIQLTDYKDEIVNEFASSQKNYSWLNNFNITLEELFPYLSKPYEVLDATIPAMNMISIKIMNDVLSNVVRKETPKLYKVMSGLNTIILQNKLHQSDKESNTDILIRNTVSFYEDKSINKPIIDMDALFMDRDQFNSKINNIYKLLTTNKIYEQFPNHEMGLIELLVNFNNMFKTYNQMNTYLEDIGSNIVDYHAIETTLSKLKIPAFGFDIDKSKIPSAFDTQRLEEYDPMREHAMTDILVEYINKNPADRIITLTGATHIRPDSELIQNLKNKQIPYTSIILKHPNPEGPSADEIWFHIYKTEHVRQNREDKNSK